MKVLVVGSGGREHALAWKLAQGARVQTVFVAPGNGGTAADPVLKNVPFHGVTDIAALADFAVAEKVALTVVGPEAPLAAGIVDQFRARGLRVFGPTQSAAQLESSKDFAKRFRGRVWRCRYLGPETPDWMKPERLVRVDRTTALDALQTEMTENLWEFPAAGYAQMQEVAQHFTRDPETKVSIRVEIDAERPEGFNDTTVRTVSENARTLKFKQSEFGG